jgi:hypothetical protein
MAASFLLPLPTAADDSTHSTHWDGRESEPYLAGEYKIVLQLIGVLGNGKMAKRLTDSAIEYVPLPSRIRQSVILMTPL